MALDFPNTPTNGQIFTTGDGSWLWDTVKWKSGNGVGFLTTIADTPPPVPTPGLLWWNSSPGIGQLYVYYNDGTSSQWVTANNMGGGLYLPLTGGTIAGNLNVSGTVAAPGGIVGVTNGSSAASGMVGEYFSQTGGATPMTTGAWGNTNTFSLPAGDWDVWGYIQFSASGAVLNYVAAMVSTSPTSVTGPMANFATQHTTTGAFSVIYIPTVPVRFSLTVTTSLYVIGYCQFSSGTCNCTGTAFARRH
jgi:hypothetical protein